jgi:mRNA interferase MazF
VGKILRGDIIWADLNPIRGNEQAGHRPVLIISEDIFNEHSGTVIALAITCQPQKAGFPLTYHLGKKNLPKDSWIKISQIRTLSIERLGNKMGHISHPDMEQILEGLKEIIGG